MADKKGQHCGVGCSGVYILQNIIALWGGGQAVGKIKMKF